MCADPSYAITIYIAPICFCYLTEKTRALCFSISASLCLFWCFCRRRWFCRSLMVHHLLPVKRKEYQSEAAGSSNLKSLSSSYSYSFMAIEWRGCLLNCHCLDECVLVCFERGKGKACFALVCFQVFLLTTSFSLVVHRCFCAKTAPDTFRCYCNFSCFFLFWLSGISHFTHFLFLLLF